MKQNQVKWGAILSYTLIFINTLYGLLVTPYIVGCLGDAEYGVYKTISSLAASMMVLDLGIGGTVLRYIANFRAKNEEDRIPNFVAMSFMQAVLMCAVIALVACGLYHTLEITYASTFTHEQIEKAKLLFCLLAANIVLHVIENVASGVITGFNRFAVSNGIKVLRLITRILLICILLDWFNDSLVIVIVDIAVTLVFLIGEFIYIIRGLGIHIRITQWEKSLFVESGKYTALMFLTSIAAQVNNSLDNIAIGALSGPKYVAVYSFGLLIFGMFEQLSTSISSVMLPTVTVMLESKNGITDIQKLIVRVGRIQFMLLGAAFMGFVCLGKEFISIWLGKGYEDVYIITLILMGPALFELCVNVCLAILRAKNMLTFRTMVLFSSTVLNAVVTYVAVKKYSYIGAAFGTAISFIVGSLIVMNIYYQRKLGLPMLAIYRCIFSKSWVCLLLASLVLLVFKQTITITIWTFIVGVVLFLVLFIAGMVVFGFNEDERRNLKIGGKS